MRDGDVGDRLLAETHALALNTIAARAIRRGLDHGTPIELASVPAALTVPRATFVTLEHDGSLRGCIGGLEARQPLAADVAAHAFAAAFHDPRFAPVSEREWPDLTAAISILGPPVPLAVNSEAEMIAALRPGIDGVVITDGPRRGVFLPKVWEEVPEPAQFVALLKRKAGLAEGHWSASTRVERFSVEAVPPANLAALLG